MQEEFNLIAGLGAVSPHVCPVLLALSRLPTTRGRADTLGEDKDRGGPDAPASSAFLHALPRRRALIGERY